MLPNGQYIRSFQPHNPRHIASVTVFRHMIRTMNNFVIVFVFVAGIVLADESSPDAPSDTPESTEACQREYDYIEALENQVWTETGVRPTSTTKPQCLDDGTYAPRQCMYGHCRCVGADGTILTKSDFTEVEAVDTDCSCARAHHDYSQMNMFGKMFRCTAIGSYDPVQCTGSVCYCADTRGEQLGEESVNIGLIETLSC